MSTENPKKCRQTKASKPLIPADALENKCDEIGRFWTVDKPLKVPSRHLLSRLVKHYGPENLERLIVHRALKTLEVAKTYELSPTLERGLAGISLRCLEWLVTNYAKKHQVVLYNSERKRRVHIYGEYEDQLNHCKRVRFDPFCRYQRIYFQWPLINKETGELEEVVLPTTVGQLNFMQWADSTGVLQYAQTNEDKIQKDMEQVLAVVNKEKKRYKKAGKKRKRKELSRAPDTYCTVYSVDTVLLFDQQFEEFEAESRAKYGNRNKNAPEVELNVHHSRAEPVNVKRKKRKTVPEVVRKPVPVPDTRNVLPPPVIQDA